MNRFKGVLIYVYRLKSLWLINYSYTILRHISLTLSLSPSAFQCNTAPENIIINIFSVMTSKFKTNTKINLMMNEWISFSVMNFVLCVCAFTVIQDD